MVQKILRITQDTVFKLRPEQVSDLTSEERYNVSAGSTFSIQSYAYADANSDFQGHVKFALADQFIRGLNTWFVYSLHAQIEFDGKIVYPQEDQVSRPILRINQSTILKRRPIQSSQLPNNEICQVVRGQYFDLQSYAYADSQGDFSSHIKVSLRYQKDFIRGLSTWFVYDHHAYIEYDEQVVYPPEDPDAPVLRINRDTLFKRRPLQSSELSTDEVYAVKSGSLWKLQSYAYADARGSFNGHIKFALKYEKDYIQRLSTWYVYSGDAQIERNGAIVYPPQSPSAPLSSYQGKSFKLPGNTSTFYTDQPIIPGDSFTWGEATKDAARIPPTVTIVNNIIALARELEKARNQIGKPFQINSWYRPPDINQAVGGVSNSQHLEGKAADIQVAGLSGRRIANVLMLQWTGGIGIYSNLPDVVHLDIGPKRTWGF